MQLPPFKNLFVSAHLLVLLGLLTVMFLPLTWPISLPAEFWIKQGIENFLYAFLFYLNLFVIVPKLLFKGRGGLFTVVLSVSLIAMVLVNHFLDKVLDLPDLISKIITAHHGDTAFQKVPVAELGILIITLIVYGISTIMAVAQKIQRDSLREQDLEKQKVMAELSFLKTQINPHFFFNVLHTIYALIDQDIVLAKESVYTLSHMMRYVLYETGNDKTTMKKEIAFIEDYIKLMNLRLSKQVQVIFEKPNGFQNAELAPMLFLPYIENAYKHGIRPDHPSYIYIGLEQNNDELEFEVRNSLFIQKADHLEQSNGIGLVNTERRLELLYPGKHELQVLKEETAGEFVIKLKLGLK